MTPLKKDHPLDSIRIVMVNTSHSGNIGSAARAMRVMGLYNLTLVNPKKFPSQDATALASGALDVLENAIITETLQEAIADCDYVIGTSARMRESSKQQRELADGANAALDYLHQHPASKIAILFGTERTGLTNDELDLCHELLYIPTENSYNSLNIAAAIQVIAYEFRKQSIKERQFIDKPKDVKLEPANQASLEGYFNHLEETLHAIDFIKGEHSTHLMRKLRILYQKANLTNEEVNILRGILTETQRKIS